MKRLSAFIAERQRGNYKAQANPLWLVIFVGTVLVVFHDWWAVVLSGVAVAGFFVARRRLHGR
jgi:hypothetical protein